MVSKSQSKVVAALDIGTSKIAAAVGKMGPEGRLDLLGLCQEKAQGVQRGVITNIEKTVRAIERVIKKVSGIAGANLIIASVNLSGDRSIKRTLYSGKTTCQKPKEGVTRGDVRRLTSDAYKIADKPGWNILHIFPQDYQVDERESVTDLVGTVGTTLSADFNVIATRSTAITHLRTCLTRAGLREEKIIFSPIAASYAVLSEEEKKMGVCLVDIGAGVTDMAVFQDSMLTHASVIPFGGQHVSQDIRQLFGLLFQQAEELKLQHGNAICESVSNAYLDLPVLKNHPPKQINLKHLAHIIQARMEEIVTLVYQEIKSLNKPLGAGIKLTGGVAQLKNLCDLFQRTTGHRTQIGYPGDLVVTPENHKNIDDPAHATCVGLAIATLDQKNEDPLQNPNNYTKPTRSTKSDNNLLRRFMDMFRDEDDKID